MTDRTRAQRVAAVLEIVASISREIAAARARPFGDHRLSRSQLDALFLLARATSPVTSGDLASHLSVTPGAVTQLVAGLREIGLVDVAPAPTDARMRLIALTAHARADVAAFESAAVHRLLPRFAALTDSELDQVVSLLAAVDLPLRKTGAHPRTHSDSCAVTECGRPTGLDSLEPR